MTQTQKRENWAISEFLLVIYCFSFSFLKPLTVTLKSYSTLILLVSAIAIIAIYIFVNLNRLSRMNFLRFLIFLLSLFIVAGTQFVFWNNSMLFSCLYSFCIYGLIPAFLLINVKNYSKLLKYWCYTSFVAGIIFLPDPFLGYQWSGGYMPLGFNHLLPAFGACIVLWLYYNKKWSAFAALILFAEMFLYANKGAALTAVVYFAVFYLFAKKENSNKKVLCAVLAMIITIIFVYIFRFQIFDFVYDLAQNLGINSYALKTFRELLYTSGDRIYSQRIDIWIQCLEEFAQKPIFGMGIGGFQAEYGYYPHNVFLEILVSFGIFGLSFFIIAILAGIKYIKKTTDADKKTFLLMMLILWILPMQISLSLWNYAMFWVYWGSFIYKSNTSINSSHN